MSAANKPGGIEPLPRYVMPDASAPAYDEILGQLLEYHRSHIGSSYYYLRAENQRVSLCRIVPGAGKVFFHEIVNHARHGISEDDLDHAVSVDTGVFSLEGYFPISENIENKLRMFF